MMTIAPKPNNSAKNPEFIDRVRRFLVRAYSRAALPYLAAGLLLIVAIVVGGREIQHHIIAIESWIKELDPWGVLAFIGLFALATWFLLPGGGPCIAHLHDLAIIGGLAVCITVMVLVSKMARKAVMQTVAETEKAGGLTEATAMTSRQDL